MNALLQHENTIYGIVCLLRSKHTVLFLTLLAVLVPVGSAYGHGLGLDTATINADGEKIDLTVELPMDQLGEKQLTITAKEAGTTEPVRNAVLEVTVLHNNETVFSDVFFSKDGTFAIRVDPTDSENVEILGSRHNSGAWSAESQLEITGPAFGTAGLYTFELKLLGMGAVSMLENPGSGRADLTIIENVQHDQKDSDGNDVKFNTKSYFDGISEFSYDHTTSTVAFEMPFDWSEKTILHIPVVHVEVRFPKDLAEYNSPSYIGTINGVKLFKSSITIDDYTADDERIVHFVLLEDHLRALKNQLNSDVPDGMIFELSTSDENPFPLTAYTANEDFYVDLSWDPIEIEPESSTLFIFTIRDGATGEPLRQSTYDFVIVQNGREIHRVHGEAVVGGTFERFEFAKDQTGPTIIKFENIRGTGAETEFGFVVVPEFGSMALLILGAALALTAGLGSRLSRMPFTGRIS